MDEGGKRNANNISTDKARVNKHAGPKCFIFAISEPHNIPQEVQVPGEKGRSVTEGT